MKCKKCLHYEVCVKLGKPSLYGINQEIGCLAYKDKEKWVEKKDTITNADSIRAMSDEELAEFLESTHTNMALKLGGEYIVREKEYIVIWLKRPAE